MALAFPAVADVAGWQPLSEAARESALARLLPALRGVLSESTRKVAVFDGYDDDGILDGTILTPAQRTVFDRNVAEMKAQREARAAERGRQGARGEGRQGTERTRRMSRPPAAAAAAANR